MSKELLALSEMAMTKGYLEELSGLEIDDLTWSRIAWDIDEEVSVFLDRLLEEVIQELKENN